MKINGVSPLYLILGKINGYFGEINRNKYLTLVPTIENKEMLKKYEVLWSKITELIRSITKKKSDDNDAKYLKIKLDSNDGLPLNKTIEIHITTIVVGEIFLEINKFYMQVFLDEYLYKLKL